MTEEVIYPTALPGPPLDLCHLTNKLQVTCLWRIIHAQTQTDSTHIDGPLDWLIAVITFTFDYQRIDHCLWPANADSVEKFIFNIQSQD